MAEFPFTPSSESVSQLKGNQGLWGDKLRLSANFKFDEIQKNDFLIFHSQNAFNDFFYYLKDKRVGQTTQSSVKAEEVDAVASVKDGVNLWVNEDIVETWLNAGDGDVTVDITFAPAGTIRVAMEYVGEAEYLYITEGGNLLTVSVQNDNLVMSLKTSDSSSTVAIPIGDLYEGGDVFGQVISFSIGYDTETFRLSHNGQIKVLDNNVIDMTNATFQCLQNTYDFIVLDTELPDRILQIINQPLVDTVTISVVEPDVTISEPVIPKLVYN